MGRAIIFGAGELGKKIYKEIKYNYEVIAFIDNFSERQGKRILDVTVFPFEEINDINFDFIFIGSTTGYDSMIAQLKEINVPSFKIIDTYARDKALLKRKFLMDFSKVAHIRNLQGNVAEAGVFQGEYAKYINDCFPDRLLYLFDTFKGFDKKDRNDYLDKDINGRALFDDFEYLSMTSEKIVLSKMKNPENCLVKKGYFPSTTQDIEDSFVFVSLDMDLYQPTYEGLKFFYPRMVEGGVIILDDYFNFSGIQRAVADFIKENSKEYIRMLPICDSDNIIICK